MSSPVLDRLEVSLLIPRSHASTESNKTGSWSFARPAYRDKTAPCRAACPCATDIPRVESLAAEGRFGEALAAILEENPLPSVCGRVCFHPCESRCNRADLDEAVSVNALERFLGDSGGAAASAPAAPAKGQSAIGHVAIVGSGPAGLAAAYFLGRLGYACEILEAESEAGGLLRHGIPAYRLPPEALDRDLERIEALGASFRFGARIGPEEISELRSRPQGPAAVVLAAGHSRPRRLGLPGQELALEALDFLKATRLGGTAVGSAGPSGKTGLDAPSAAGGAGRVAVIGGGNTAVDAARSLRRLGYEPTIVYRRARADMPAFPEEVEAAIAEGVALVETSAPMRIERSSHGLALTVLATRPEGAGLDGRARFVPVPGRTRVLEVSAVYSAIGAQAAEAWMQPGESSLRLGRCAIELEGAGAPLAFVGDLGSPRETVADSIASGKEAAIALDAFLRFGRESIAARTGRCVVGDGDSLSMAAYLGGLAAVPSPRVVAFSDLNADYFTSSPRRVGDALPPDRAHACFDEVRLGLGREEALAQASRCLGCGRCDDCDNCRTFCPELAVRVASPRARRIDADYCKGCGICAAECPRSAIEMEGSAS